MYTLPNPGTRDLDLEHLQAELARLDLSLAREVRRWQRAGQDPSDAFRGLCLSDEQADALLDRPLCTHWGQTVDLDPADAQRLAEAVRAQATRSVALADEACRRGRPLRLASLATAFGLDPFEIDVLLVCLAPDLDLRYERLYGYLQDDLTRKRPSINLLLDLLCPPGPEHLTALCHLTDEAPLFRYQLLERVPDSGPAGASLLAQPLRVHETVVHWLLGRYCPPPELPGAALLPPEETELDTLLAAAALPHLGCNAADEPVYCLLGPDPSRQAAAARLLAARLDSPLLMVDLAAASTAGVAPLSAARLALRDARLTGAIPCLNGWDTCLRNGAPPAALLAEVLAHPSPAIVAGEAVWQAGGVGRSRRIVRVELPRLDYAQRRALWLYALGSAAPAGALDVTSVASQFLLQGGQIRDAVASAQDDATQRGEALAVSHLLAAARSHSNSGLTSLARKIVPRYGWQDIVLPADQRTLLREIIATVRERPLVLEQWAVGRKLAAGSGVTMLFAGPPGTGKTMAAEIIARELGLDLFKIDLSTVISKYIGETEKNLERIFVEAITSNAILFFDEADALFGKRSEVRDSHDRYANIEISYLLQRMEAYEGVTILATNLRANLDEAFTRRLQFALDFPFPDEDDRLHIWQALFPSEVPRAADIDLPLLARRYKLAGGSIRNILVGAAYLAAADGQVVTMDHLLHATRRELQKMGRLLDEGDRDQGAAWEREMDSPRPAQGMRSGDLGLLT
ncbi:MAG: ATP-binding protein [Anaerolineae bacterium]